MWRWENFAAGTSGDGVDALLELVRRHSLRPPILELVVPHVLLLSC